MNKIQNTVALSVLLLAQPMSSFAAPTTNMDGTWGAVMLQGDFNALSQELSKFKWQIMNQTRTRDDSPSGQRFTENLLFGQLGYQMTNNASFWVGYVHDWISPLTGPTYQESRPYQDFVWNQSISDFKLTSRTRFEERINLTTNNTGYRARQLIQVSHSLPFVKDLSAYVGDEVLGYMNQNNFGKQGFSENRILSGLSYQFTPKLGADLGYMGQYVSNVTGNNLFTHNVQVNIIYKF